MKTSIQSPVTGSVPFETLKVGDFFRWASPRDTSHEHVCVVAHVENRCEFSWVLVVDLTAGTAYQRSTDITPGDVDLLVPLELTVRLK